MVHRLPWSWSLIFFTNGCQREMDQGGYGESSTYTMGWYGKTMGMIEESKVWLKVVVGRPSQCIYRVFQDFVSHGNDPWYFIVHGICPWFLTHSHFRVFWSFLREWGYVAIHSHLPRIYGGRINDVLDQFGWNLIVKDKMEGIMVGLWCIIMVWTIESYVNIFWC